MLQARRQAYKSKGLVNLSNGNRKLPQDQRGVGMKQFFPPKEGRASIYHYTRANGPYLCLNPSVLPLFSSRKQGDHTRSGHSRCFSHYMLVVGEVGSVAR